MEIKVKELMEARAYIRDVMRTFDNFDDGDVIECAGKGKCLPIQVDHTKTIVKVLMRCDQIADAMIDAAKFTIGTER